VNITREDLPDRQVALTIELGPEEMEPALQKAYRQLVGRVNIPGFRPGKAPRPIFERFVGREALIEQAVEGMIGTTLHQAIDEQGIEHTDISDVRIESTSPVTVRVVIDQPAKVELPDVSDIRVEREPVEVDDDKVEEVITELRKREGTWSTPEEPRPARTGDRVVIDMETYTIDGPVPNMTGESLSIELAASSAPTWPQEIDQNIVGMSPGDEKDFAITFPSAYPDEALREKDATVHVKLHSLEEQTLPDLDEAFTQKVAQLESVDELRQRIRENLLSDASAGAESKQVDEVIRQMVERSTVEVPRALIDREVDRQFERLSERMRQSHIDPRRYFSLTGTSEEEWRIQQRDPARDRVRQTLVLGEFAQREGIDVAPEDVEAAISERMEPYVGTPSEDRIREIFDTPEQRQQLENVLFERRLVDRLIALAEGRTPEPAATAAPAEAETEAEAGSEAAPVAASAAPATDGTTGADGDVLPTPEITGAVPATAQEPGPLETAGGAAEVLSAGSTEETETASTNA
jgi:trigger factor